MRAEIDKGTMPGAVTLIARHGKVVHFEAHGYLDSGKTKPMTQDAVFRMFSMTKPFVSVAAMMLVEQGRMKLSDPVSTWIPEFKDMKVLIEKKDAAGNVTREPVPAERPITVQDLLRHTSGFAYADNAPFPELKDAYTKADIESRETDVSPEELVQRLAGIPLAWQPGTRWQYGVSTDVLGVLLERLTGKRLDLLLDGDDLQATRDEGHELPGEAGADGTPGRRVRRRPAQGAGLEVGAGRGGPGEAVPPGRRGDGVDGGGLLPLRAAARERRRTRRRAAPVAQDGRVHAVGPHPGLPGLNRKHHGSRLRLWPRLRAYAGRRASRWCPARRATRCGQALAARASPSTRRSRSSASSWRRPRRHAMHTRFLFKNLLYGALVQ